MLEARGEEAEEHYISVVTHTRHYTGCILQTPRRKLLDLFISYSSAVICIIKTDIHTCFLKQEKLTLPVQLAHHGEALIPRNLKWVKSKK